MYLVWSKIPLFSEKSLKILQFILKGESTNSIQENLSRYILIKGILEDNKTNRELVKKIKIYSENNYEGYINDQNYFGSKDRRFHYFRKEEEKEMFKFIKDFDLFIENFINLM